MKYGPLDQYLMGLRAAAEVPPTFVVTTDYLTDTEGFPVPVGQQRTISGRRVEVTVEDIIRQMGARDPATEKCHWKGAFVVIHDPGSPPTPAQLDLVDAYRVAWEAWYAWATDGRGSFDTTLDGRGSGTNGCPGEPLPPLDGDDEMEEPADGDTPDLDGDYEDEGPVDGDADSPEESDLSDGPDATDLADSPETPTPACDAGSVACNGTGTAVIRCRADRAGWEVAESCSSDGLVCEDGRCVDEAQGGQNGVGGCGGGRSPVWLALFGLLALLGRRAACQ